MSEVSYRTWRSFGKYLKTWKFHYFLNIHVFFQRPNWYRSVCHSDMVRLTKKYINVPRTYCCVAYKRSLHQKFFSSAAQTASFSNWFLTQPEKPPCFLNLVSGKRKSESKLFFTAFFDRFCHFNRAYATHRSFGRPLVKTRSPEMEPGPQTLLYQFANPCKS